ncbi:MAG: four helix bundle protein [Patescibacteria group bacterium]|nr:four helix bundle protein [Patescibacteria group bacterium]
MDLKTRVYKFSLVVIRFLGEIQPSQINRIITNQLLRSAIYNVSEIIEAQAASSKNDFKNFMNHSLKSANETKYWLFLLRDAELVENMKIESLIREATELSKILGASMLRLKGRK